MQIAGTTQLHEASSGKALESESHSVLSNSLWPYGLYSPWDSPGQNTGVGSLYLLQGIFSTQESSPGLLQCRQILYQLSQNGSPGILEWVAYPFSSRSSDLGIKPGLLHCRQFLYQLSYQGSPNSAYHLLNFSNLLFFGPWHPWDFSNAFKIPVCVYLVKNQFTVRNSRVSNLYGLMWCYFVHLLSNSQILWTSFCDMSVSTVLSSTVEVYCTDKLF